MRASRWGILFWSALIVVLLVVEVAEITHRFTLPVQSAIGDPLGFVFTLVFTTIFALVGAIFIGAYFSAWVLRSQGFTPFEEEMLRMRAEIRDIKAAVERTSLRDPGPAAPPTDPPKGRVP